MGKKHSKRGANLIGGAGREYALAARKRVAAEAALNEERDEAYEEDSSSDAVLEDMEAVDDAALDELGVSDDELQPGACCRREEPGDLARRKRAQEWQQNSRRRKKAAQEGARSITAFFSAAPSSKRTEESCPAEVAVGVPLDEASDVVSAIGVAIAPSRFRDTSRYSSPSTTVSSIGSSATGVRPNSTHAHIVATR